MKKIEEILSLKGKRVLITGAASKIGRSIAYRYAEIEDSCLHRRVLG
ncbi:hypothetical protein [Aciduliprofundum sp. MAR08-339]